MHRLIPFTIAATALSLPCLSHGQVVITEIMYHPQSIPLFNDVDWVEIYNNSDEPVDVENWRLFDQFFLLKGGEGSEAGEAAAPEPFNSSVFSGGVETNSSILRPFEVAVIINGRTDSLVQAAAFRERWSLPPSVKIIAPNWGQEFDMEANPLGTYFPDSNTISSDSADPEWIALTKADGTIVDVVDYRNNHSIPFRGWPDAGSNSEPNGGSIYLKTEILLGDNPTGDNDASTGLEGNDRGNSWLLSVAGVDGAYNQNGGGLYSPNDVGSPGYIQGVEIAIPEPAAMGLLVGLSALFGYRRRR